MLMNLFNSFDPMMNNFPINWILILMNMLFMINKFWLFMNYQMKIYNIVIIKYFLYMNVKFNKNYFFLMMNLFNFMLMNNLMNMMPFNFNISSNINFPISLSLMMWLTYMLFLFTNNYYSMMMNLLPNNTPMTMAPFISMIELMSLMTQWLTLTIRLSINMMMGHLMMSLLNNSINMIIILFEIFIILIQTYIFFLLNMMYSKEII